MAAISQTTFSSAFLWMNNSEFEIKFHWNMFNVLVQIMAWRWRGAKPLSEAMMLFIPDAYMCHSVAMSQHKRDIWQPPYKNSSIWLNWADTSLPFSRPFRPLLHNRSNLFAPENIRRNQLPTTSRSRPWCPNALNSLWGDTDEGKWPCSVDSCVIIDAYGMWNGSLRAGNSERIMPQAL